MPSPVLAGQRLAVLGTPPMLDELAGGLRDHGADVATITATRDFAGALDDAESTMGGLSSLVWAATGAQLGNPQPLASLDGPTWAALLEDPLRSYVEFLQAAYRRLRDRGGQVVVLVPTIAMSGAPGLAAWATVAEAQRSLAKSAARVWGADGITLNCVAVPANLLVRTPDGGDLNRADLQATGLAAPRLGGEVAAVVASLCSPDWGGVTGATIGVDGGRWMTP
jgi:NAD(P)-dependent dehydrogenase (short-subunit alcohol dehydrogenase family)